MTIRLFTATHGLPGAQIALDYTIWLAGLLQAEVTLLGVVETPESLDHVTGIVDQTAARLAAQDIPFHSEIQHGQAEALIKNFPGIDTYLVIMGRLDRSLIVRGLHGRSIRGLLEALHSSVIYVTEPHPQMNHILLCQGGMGLGMNMIHRAATLAASARADVTLLHVIEPATYHYPTTDALHHIDSAAEFLATATPQALHIREALDVLAKAGVEAQLIVREGFVEHTIKEQIQHTPYDLIGLGSHYSGVGLRHQFTPNISTNIAIATDIPVLIVR